MRVFSWTMHFFYFPFQAHKSGDPKGKEVSLLLAERMVNNFVKDGKIEAEAEVMTYLHILETQVENESI